MGGGKCLTDYVSVLKTIIAFMVFCLGAKSNLANTCTFSTLLHTPDPVDTPEVQISSCSFVLFAQVFPQPLASTHVKFYSTLTLPLT